MLIWNSKLFAIFPVYILYIPFFLKHTTGYNSLTVFDETLCHLELGLCNVKNKVTRTVKIKTLKTFHRSHSLFDFFFNFVEGLLLFETWS